MSRVSNKNGSAGNKGRRTILVRMIKAAPVSKEEDRLIGPGAIVHGGVVLGKNVRVGAFTVIFQGTVIDDDCDIQPFCLVGLPCGDGRQTTMIGKGAIIRSGTVIYAGVTAGNGLKTGHNAVIRECSKLGDNVLVGSQAVVDGDVVLGSGVSLQTGAYITRNTVLHDGVFMGPYACTTNDRQMLSGAKLMGPVIGSGAKIGAQAVILPGIRVGADAVIGAGAVVARDVPPAQTVVGVPAEKIRK